MTTLIEDDEHVSVYGITGGGKSYWLKNYLATRDYVLKIDTKGEALIDLAKKQNPWPQVDPAKLAILLNFEQLSKHDFKKRPYVIYVPDMDEDDDKEHFNMLFKWIFNTFKKTGMKVWIDELGDVVEGPHTILKYLKWIYKKGRFFKITIWAAAQEPRHIHSICMSQSTHIVAFDLPRKDDRKRLADDTGCDQFMELPTGFVFWYFRRGWREAVKGVIG